MRIDFSRSGGVAGMTMRTSVDVDTLPADVRRQVCDWVEASDFFSLPAQPAAGSGGADRFNYEIRIEDTGRSHSISIGEADAPQTLRPLLDWLNRTARGNR
jgi:hypothetical protein